MNQLLTKFHTSVILIIFIVTICLLGLGLKEDFIILNKEEFYNHTLKPVPKFNIDEQIKTNKEHLGWKSFWRENYSKLGSNIEKIFVNKPFSKCKDTQLKYDGVFVNPPILKL
jgi:hypothetical protein